MTVPKDGQAALVRGLRTLLVSAQKGDETALHKTVDLLMPVAFRAIYARLGGGKARYQDRQDFAQDAWVKLRELVLKCDADRPETVAALVWVSIDRMILTKIMRQKRTILLEDPDLYAAAPFAEDDGAVLEAWPITERQLDMVRAYRDAIATVGCMNPTASHLVRVKLGIHRSELCRLRQRVRERLKGWRRGHSG